MKSLTWYHSPNYPTDHIMSAREWLRHIWIMAATERDTLTESHIEEYDPLERIDK